MTQWFDDVRADVRYAVRGLRRTPGFTAAAVLTLALAIGATTAVFSVVSVVLLRPLPYDDPARIVGVWNAWDGTPRGRISPAEYFDYLRDVSAFEHFGVFAGDTVTLTEPGGEPERVRAGFVTFGVLDALGVSPAQGAAFTRDDDRPGSGDKVLLSDALWRRRFGASPAAVGTPITLDGRRMLIAGVLPQGFRLPDELSASEPVEVLVPLTFEPVQAATRGNHFLNGVARLRRDVTLDAASAEVAAVAGGFARTMPGEYPPRIRFTARATSLSDDVTGSVRPALLLLLAAIGCVLLIACTNVTNLFLSRAEARARDAAVRAALGAGRVRLIVTALVESAIVAGAGGAAGVLVAATATRALPWLRPMDLPRSELVAVDWRVLLFAAGLSVAVGLTVGVLPAHRASRVAPQEGLSGDTRVMAIGGRGRLRHALIAAQIGLAIVLLLGAALLVTSFQHLVAVDPGYRTDNLIAVDLSLPDTSYPDGDRTASFYNSLLEALRQQPGVEAAGAVVNLPLASPYGDLNIQIEGRETPRGTPSRRADWQVVTPGYFEALGIRLRQGRGIEPTDRADTPGVVVINETMARQYWGGMDPIGQRFRLGGGAGPGWVTVVGIVGAIRHNSLTDEPGRQMYLAHTQFRFWGGGMQPARALTVVARTAGNPVTVAGVIRREVRALDAGLPLGTIRTMEDVRAESVSGPRFLTLLLSGFSVIALAIALVGIYSVVAYSVAQRRREIGVRLALGAAPRAIVALVVRQGMMPAAIGLVTGLAGGLMLAGVLRAFLFQVEPRDPAVAIAVTVVVAGVALLACVVPARRAGATDPVVALRPE
jgi:putative ABC transport system permease protein